MNKIEQIITLSKDLGSKPIIACIGSTKDIKDSLGPITGQLLVEKYKVDAIVIGTLLSPLHALNITQRMARVCDIYPQSKTLAIDACRFPDGKHRIRLIKGGIKPGLASGKNLPRVGNYSIVASTEELHSNALCLGSVYSLADKIAKLVVYTLSLRQHRIESTHNLPS